MPKLLRYALLLFAVGLCHAPPVLAQALQPGFDQREYVALMHVSAQFGDSAYAAALPPPPTYTRAYRSPAMGLDNRWELWIRGDGGGGDSGGSDTASVATPARVAVVSLRGTTERSESWLANLYAAMVPASGALTVADDYTFDYALADDPRAAVHVGWLVSTAFLARDILPRLDSCYRAGIRDAVVVGHSQGGAIAYLLTAHLYALQRAGRLPADLRLKTYCSAAPKPGNLYFAYAYEALTQNGWAYNVVNSADWVPETPVTVQTVADFNHPNPFDLAPGMIAKQPLRARLALKFAYNKLYKPTLRAQANYQRILGDYTSRQIAGLLPGFVAPRYFDSNDYVRTGATITLLADAAYRAWNPMDSTQLFGNHFHAQYLYLAERLALDYRVRAGASGAAATADLTGCYLDAKPGYRISADLEQSGADVTGRLAYDFAEKDDNDGTFAGSLRGDTLVGVYTFASEGSESRREVAFLHDDDGGLAEGYGDARDEAGAGVQRFADVSAVTFGAGVRLARVDCAELEGAAGE